MSLVPRDVLDRFRGALVGSAVGDALGAPIEGRSRVPRSYLESIEVDPPNLTYTDDTAMTIGVARSLVEKAGFDGDHMAGVLAAIYRREPWRGYGSGPPIVFALREQDVPWDEAATGLFDGEGSFGNGAAMRVAPVALHAFPDRDAAADLAHQTAIITHSHPEGIDGAVVQAVAIAMALTVTTIELDRIPAGLLDRVSTSALRGKLEFLAENADRPVGEIAMALGNGIAARDSVVTALACFLANPDDFRLAIRSAIGLGGDTDTIGAMTGALSGAYLGLGAIPGPWRGVEGATELTALADALAERHSDR